MGLDGENGIPPKIKEKLYANDSSIHIEFVSLPLRQALYHPQTCYSLLSILFTYFFMRIAHSDIFFSSK